MCSHTRTTMCSWTCSVWAVLSLSSAVGTSSSFKDLPGFGDWKCSHVMRIFLWLMWSSDCCSYPGLLPHSFVGQVSGMGLCCLEVREPTSPPSKSPAYGADWFLRPPDVWQSRSKTVPNKTMWGHGVGFFEQYFPWFLPIVPCSVSSLLF